MPDELTMGGLNPVALGERSPDGHECIAFTQLLDQAAGHPAALPT